jgi:cytoskeletal protein CcmA (bactofilin family)
MSLLKRDEPMTEHPHTVLGAGAEFEGKLVFKGAVRIDGRFKGEVVTEGMLIIGEHATVEGQVQVGVLVVLGTVRGEVMAKDTVQLQSSARFYGSVMTAGLVIERGAVFQGTCKMEVEPIMKPHIVGGKNLDSVIA